MANTRAELRIAARPYRPSWIDRFTNWVEGLPMRRWVFYAGLGLVLVLIQMLFLWLDDGLRFDALLPPIVFNALMIPYSLALIHLLDNQAVTALNAMRPTLAVTEPEFHELQYRLSTMRSRPTFIVGVTLSVFLVLTERWGTVPVRYAALDDLRIFTVIYHAIDKSIALVFGPFIYHSIAQLRLVNTIYSNHTRINLFDQKPLYAFSKLTASTAAGLAIPIYGWMLINPELWANSLSLGATVVFTILGLAAFVWPLIGAHRLMEMEKERLLHDIDLQFEVVFAMLSQRIQDGDYSAKDEVNGTIASLDIQHRKVKAIPTWPWKPETARLILTVLALPPVLRLIQSLVERLFDR